MYFVYTLISKKDGNFYVGFTNNLNRRAAEHFSGKVIATKSRQPLELIYYETCLNQKDALAREKYLKSGKGKKYIKNRLKNYLIWRSNH